MQPQNTVYLQQSENVVLLSLRRTEGRTTEHCLYILTGVKTADYWACRIIESRTIERVLYITNIVESPIDIIWAEARRVRCRERVQGYHVTPVTCSLRPILRRREFSQCTGLGRLSTILKILALSRQLNCARSRTIIQKYCNVNN